jgi:hypothetical protein
VSLSSGHCLLDEVNFDAATYPIAPGSAFLRGGSGDVTCPTAPGGPWITEIKKGLAVLTIQLGSSVSKAHSCVTKSMQDIQTATVRFNSATSAQLITAEHGYNGDMIRQDDTTPLAMFSTTV